MNSRIALAIVLCFSFVQSISAQTVVRFDTTAGDFDMVLNPTGDVRLNEHVDNLVRYVTDRRYHCTVINRAAENFVLQMGGFRSDTMIVPSTADGFEAIQKFDPIAGVPAAGAGFTNSRGTIAMALSGLPTGGTNQNSGTSSFFVNLTDNTFLDPDFTVFAVIPDLTTIDIIMGLDQVDLTAVPGSGAAPGNLAFSDIPIHDNGNMVFIERAFLIEDTITTSLLTNTALAQLANPGLVAPAGAPSVAASAATASATSSAVPEPTSALLALLAAVSCGFVRHR